ncbi:MAG: exonuclease domain-containing protein, partial [Pseudomonadales bacterium]
VFENGRLRTEWKSLVDPQDFFDPFNSSVHGIEPHHVTGAPIFSTIATDFFDLLGDHPVVAHTHFDRTAIAQTCRKYGIFPPILRWLDSARVARRAWPQFAMKGYGLKNVCTHIGYSFEHHDALEDAKAAGHVLIAAIRESGISLDEWFGRVTKPIDLEKSGSDARQGNPDGALFGEILVFTGTLEIPRREAADMAAKAGCTVAKGVTKKTTLLVVGDQDTTKLAGHDKSSKHRKAEELMATGVQIRVLRESDFRQIIEGV